MDHLVSHLNWFTPLIEGISETRNGRGRPRQEHIDVIEEKKVFGDYETVYRREEIVSPPTSIKKKTKKINESIVFQHFSV